MHPTAETIAVQVDQLEQRIDQLEAIATRAILALGRITDFLDEKQCVTYAWLERDFENAVGHQLSLGYD